MTFYIVDVFAESKFAGNQLAVFRNGQHFTSRQMQRIAKEMGYSETTFIMSQRKEKGGYKVRIFTPEEEIPFAGHPTLGTAFIIRKEIVRRPVASIVLNLKVGQIPVTFTSKRRGERLVMKQKEPSFGKTLDAGEIGAVLNIGVSAIDKRYPIQEVSTGLPFIIVPLKSLAFLKKARIESQKCSALIKKTEAKAILVFTRETYKKANDLNARVFADYYGVPEDPATGSANGCLAGYLAKYRYFGKERVMARVEQGYEIGRPSLLYLEAEDRMGNIDVSVGGKVKMVAKGELV